MSEATLGEPGSGDDESSVIDRRPDLQGMRAIAVLAVFANHLFHWPSGGFVGVDVFFVLSGYFITGLLIRERTTTGGVSFLNFYTRRAKRILPTAMLVLVVTVGAAYLLLPPARARDTLLDALYAAMFSSNFRFQAIGADPFPQGQAASLVLHYWPLSVGAQFYLVWPALLAAVFIAARARRQRGIVWAAHQGLLVVASIVVVVSFGWALYQSATDPNSAYFSSLTRVWELGIGALVAIAGPWLAVIPDSRRPLLAYAGLAGVAASLFLITPHVQFPAPWAALPVLSTALVAASFHGATVQAMPLLTNPVARWLGDTSYPLYLWHWPVIVLLASRMPRGPVYFAVVIALALGVAAITYRFYEKPIRESKWLSDDIVPVPGSRRPYLTPLGWALGGAVAASLVVFAIANMSYKNTIVNAQQAATAADKGTNDRPTAGGSLDPCLGAPAKVTKGCALRNPDVPLSPPVNQLAQDDLQSELIGCYRSGEMKGDVPSCDYGYGGPDAKRIAFIGDSHAATLMPALLPILDANRWRLTTYLGNQCELSDPPPDGCADAMPGIRAELAAKKYDLVLTTNFSKSSPVAGYRKALEAIAAGGSRIAVVADNPQTSQAAIACVTRSGGDKKGGCGTPRAEALAVPDSLVAAAKGIPGGTVIDMTRFYCDAGRCPSVIGDVIVYRDVKAGGNTFITKSFAGTLAPALEEGLRSALAAQGTEKNAASTPASPSSKPGG